jgi:NADH-quinone oxidoreductase subunit L
VHPHESPKSMYVPLYVLAALSVVGGLVGIPAALGGANQFHHWLAPVLDPASMEGAAHAARMVGDGGLSALGPAAAMASSTVGAATEAAGHAVDAGHHDPTEYILMLLCVGYALFGILAAVYFYIKRPDLPGKIAAKVQGVYQLLYNKYYVDEIYGAVFVQGCINLATFCWKFLDVVVVDGAVNGTAKVVKSMGGGLAKLQTGQVQGYALAITFGAVALVAWVALVAAF